MKRILLVEDNDMIRENLTELLEMELYAYSVQVAKNGQEAIELAIQYLPDIIISDILMPTMDGYSMLEIMRGHVALKNIPVIFCSALSEQSELKKSMTLGACDYIIKPFDPDILLQKIKRYLNASLITSVQ